MTDLVLTEVAGGVGYLTLNRPQALNALSLEMIRTMTRALHAWADDAAVHAVVVRGNGEKAFCAGGDIRFFHQAALAGDPQLGQFFVEEYALNHLIHAYPKPYIALMDNVVMGGGMGISQGARLRIVTERTKMAMPETNIGLFPDVGGGWFLARTPGRLGEYLGLTGVVFGAADGLYARLADAYLPSAALPELLAMLHAANWPSADAVVDAIRRACEPHRGAVAALPADLSARQVAIDRHFSQADALAIVASLEADAHDEWAVQTAAILRKRSPTMVCVTLEQIRRARQMTLADALRMELDMMHHVFRDGDGVEGIRALAIDKDHAPTWRPATLDAVGAAAVQRFFENPWAAARHPLADLADDGGYA